MDIVDISHTTYVNIIIPPEMKVTVDKTLFIRAGSVGEVADWLREALEEVESYL